MTSYVTWVAPDRRRVVFTASKTGITISGQGSGGLDEVIGALDENEVQYGGFRVTALDQKGGVTR